MMLAVAQIWQESKEEDDSVLRKQTSATVTAGTAQQTAVSL